MRENFICIVHLSVNTNCLQTTERVFSKHIAVEWINGPSITLVAFIPHPPKDQFSSHLIFRVLPSHPISRQLQLHHMCTMYLGLLSLIWETDCILDALKSMLETTETTGSCPCFQRVCSLYDWPWAGPHSQPVSLTLSLHHWVPSTCCCCLHLVYITCTLTHTDRKCLDDTACPNSGYHSSTDHCNMVS